MRQLCGTCVELSAVFQRTNLILRVLPLPFTASPSCTLSILLSLDTSAWPSIGCLLPHAALRSLLMSLGALPSCAPSSSWRGTGLQPFSPTFLQHSSWFYLSHHFSNSSAHIPHIVFPNCASRRFHSSELGHFPRTAVLQRSLLIVVCSRGCGTLCRRT